VKRCGVLFQTISNRNSIKLDQRSNKKAGISVGDKYFGFQVVKGTLKQVQLNENALVLSPRIVDIYIYI
jgi:hypothetical protein